MKTVRETTLSVVCVCVCVWGRRDGEQVVSFGQLHLTSIWRGHIDRQMFESEVQGRGSG